MRDYLELTKPRITILILICTAVGYLFGCRTSFRAVTLIQVLLGTALMASGTSALNQWYEVDSDAVTDSSLEFCCQPRVWLSYGSERMRLLPLSVC